MSSSAGSTKIAQLPILHWTRRHPRNTFRNNDGKNLEKFADGGDDDVKTQKISSEMKVAPRPLIKIGTLID